MNLLDRIRTRGDHRDSGMSLDQYAQLYSTFNFGGLSYGLSDISTRGIVQTLNGPMTESAPNNFVGLAHQAYAANGIVFACMLVRQLLFCSIRFNWQQLRDGKPSKMFGNTDLQILETPWPGGTTQDMLSKMLTDADLAGNSYWTLQTPLSRMGSADGAEMIRLRPDWIDVVVEPRMLADGRGQVGWRKAGYAYCEGGRASGNDPVGLHPDEVAHFAPIPDPMATYRGMSWLSPILREIQADQAMTHHQRKFFDAGATVNMVIKHPTGATQDKVEKWSQEFDDKFGGVRNAWKTLQLYPGADVTPVGSNFKEIDFSDVRSGGEVRIAAAAGVPPVIVGLSKGLDSSTYSNYSQARRRLADGTAHPLWQNMSGVLQQLIKPPRPSVRLWYETSDVPFLREDEGDAADIAQTKAQTINNYITAGYQPESVVSAVEANDLGLLVHSGLYSVQLQHPGQQATPNQQADPKSNGQPQGGSANGALVKA